MTTTGCHAVEETEIDVAAAAAEPLKASGDQGSAENHPLPDLIAADKYQKSRDALGGSNGVPARSAWGMTRTARVKPSGMGY